MVRTKTEFNKAMFDLCKKLTEDALEYYKRFPHIKGIVFKTDGGSKYIKVKGFETTTHDGKNITDKGRIHCFVNSETGDIFKPHTDGGWRGTGLTENKKHIVDDLYSGGQFSWLTFLIVSHIYVRARELVSCTAPYI